MTKEMSKELGTRRHPDCPFTEVSDASFLHTGKARRFMDLTDEEIRQIVADIFSPKKVTCIKRSKKWDEITCKIYTEWESYDDDGNKITNVIPDEITLMNPFDYGSNAIQADFQLNMEDYDKLKQFCFAKGIYGCSIDWLLNNPYINIQGEKL